MDKRVEEAARARAHHRWRTVLASDEGQAVIMSIIRDLCAVDMPGRLDEFQQGRRDVGIAIISAIARIDPMLYVTLLGEHLRRQARDDALDRSIAAK